MSKSILEQLLLDAGNLNESVENHVNKNKKSVLSNTMNEEVRKYINEAVEGQTEPEADDSMTYDETTVDADTGVEAGEAGAEMGDAEGETEATSDTEFDSEEAGEESPMGDADGMDAEMDVDMGDEMPAGDEDVMDLTNASEEEVLQALKDLPDDAEIQIVKQPSYNVSINTAEPMGADMGMEAGDGMDSEMGVDMGMDSEMDSAVDAEMPMGNDDMEADPMAGEEEDENLQESKEDKPFDTSVDNVEISSGDKTAKPFATKAAKGINSKTSAGSSAKTSMNEMEDLDEACQDEAVYENKKVFAKVVAENKRMKQQLRKLVRENKQLKVNETQAIKTIQESMKRIKKLAITNTNLAYVSRLFTEHSTTKKEKLSIITKFDTAKTIGESRLMFGLLKESLDKRTTKKPKFTNTSVNLVEGVKPRKRINEQKVYVDPVQARMLEIMNYKPQG